MRYRFSTFFTSSTYLFLLPLFFVLNGLRVNPNVITWGDALRLFLFYEVAAVLILLLFRFFFKETNKAALATFISLAVYLFFGVVHDTLKKFVPISLTKYSLLLPCLFIAYFCFLLLLKKEIIAKRLLAYLNTLLGILILLELIMSVQQTFKQNDKAFSIAAKPGLPKPNVYLIVLDEYAGSAQLEHTFHFRNTIFLDSLLSLGFAVSKSATSNYSATPFSIASLLSMSYNDELKNFDYTDQNLNYCYRKIAQSNVVAGFKSLGYRFVNLSIFDVQGEESQISKTFLKAGTELITAQTLGSRLKKDLYVNFVSNNLRRTFLYKKMVMEDLHNNELLYQKTVQQARTASLQPAFIYTHLLMPHFPYYYKSNGVLNDLSVMSPENLHNMTLYLEYLHYINKRILTLLNQILQADKESVILLLSDHGYRYANDGNFVFSTLFASYNAKGAMKNNASVVTNVNVFRQLFNQLFNTQFPLLPTKNFR